VGCANLPALRCRWRVNARYSHGGGSPAVIWSSNSGAPSRGSIGVATTSCGRCACPFPHHAEPARPSAAIGLRRGFCDSCGRRALIGQHPENFHRIATLAFLTAVRQEYDLSAKHMPRTGSRGSDPRPLGLTVADDLIAHLGKRPRASRIAYSSKVRPTRQPLP
jgi:hypothetical protein